GGEAGRGGGGRAHCGSRRPAVPRSVRRRRASMTQKPIELILMRQLASSLVMPIFLVDTSGTLVYFNEPAEQILGVRFDEIGEMPRSEWTMRWAPSDADGTPLVPESQPLTIALEQ